MQIEQTELENGVLLVKLDGRLDIAGAGEADMPFAVIAGAQENVMIDMTNVDFLASIGIRVLAQTARKLTGKGGALVLVKPQDAVRKVLVATGVDRLMPIVESEEDATAHFG